MTSSPVFRTGPTQSLAVDAVAVRDDNRVALDVVRDRTAEATSSSHQSFLLEAPTWWYSGVRRSVQ
jgi:hypothetical protein